MEIEPLDGSVYHYSEDTLVHSDAGPISYQDRFRIRHWKRSEVLEARSEAGFQNEADVTTRFADLGAEYLLVRNRS